MPAPVNLAPSTEFESATFCSASKRSIQLSYEGNRNIMRILYPSGHKASRKKINQPGISRNHLN